jgi:hypothetical protein
MIDKFLVSSAWEAQFPGLYRRLPTLCSDHFLILLDNGNFHRGSRYFKFKNMWLKSKGYVDRSKQWWNSYHFQGSLSFIVAIKLKALKID